MRGKNENFLIFCHLDRSDEGLEDAAADVGNGDTAYHDMEKVSACVIKRSQLELMLVPTQVSVV